MSQDLGLAQDAATRTKAATPLGSMAHQVKLKQTKTYLLNLILIFFQMYRVMCNAGYAEKDFSSAFQFLREKED